MCIVIFWNIFKIKIIKKSYCCSLYKKSHSYTKILHSASRSTTGLKQQKRTIKKKKSTNRFVWSCLPYLASPSEYDRIKKRGWYLIYIFNALPMHWRHQSVRREGFQRAGNKPARHRWRAVPRHAGFTPFHSHYINALKQTGGTTLTGSSGVGCNVDSKFRGASHSFIARHLTQ